MPLEGRGTVARWDPDTEPLQVWTSTQTSTGVRAAIAAKLGLDLGPGRRDHARRRRRVRGQDRCTRGPRSCWSRWPPCALGRPVKFTEDRREHFISSAHERGQVQHVEVGFDDDGRLLGLDVRLLARQRRLHAVRPDRADHHLDPAARPLQAAEPTACVFESLYTNTVIVTPYRGAGRPQGCYAMERTMDAIAAHLGKDRTEVRAVNFIQPDEFPYDHGLIFQDGRTAGSTTPATTRRRWRSSRTLVGWDEFEQFRAEMARAEGRRVGIGLACYVEGTGVGPYEGAHVHVETSGRVKVATGLTTPGPGPPDRVRPDRRRRARRAVRGRRGHHRRHPADAVRRRHVRLPRRGDERLGDRAGRHAGPGRRRCGSPPTRSRRPRRTWRSSTGVVQVKGAPDSDDRARHGRGALQPAALRLRRGVEGRHPVHGRRPRQAAGRRGRRAGAGGQGLLLARAVDVRLRHARGDRRDRPGHRARSRS